MNEKAIRIFIIETKVHGCSDNEAARVTGISSNSRKFRAYHSDDLTEYNYDIRTTGFSREVIIVSYGHQLPAHLKIKEEITNEKSRRVSEIKWKATHKEIHREEAIDFFTKYLLEVNSDYLKIGLQKYIKEHF